MTDLLQSSQALRDKLRATVTYSHGRRVYDAVVFELVGADGFEVRRTIALLTGGTLRQDHDRRRIRRLSCRLKALGFSDLWHAFRHPLDGVGGTVRMRLANWTA